MNPKKSTKLDYIPISQVKFDPETQRHYNPARSKKMAKTWDDIKCGAVTLALRSDGQYYGMDGQHRIRACEMVYGKDHAIPAFIVLDTDQRLEAEVFVAINKDRQSVNAIEQHRIALVSLDPEALGVEKILAEHGYRIGRSSTGNVIGAVQSIYQCYRKSSDDLNTTLSCLTAAFDYEEGSNNGSLIMAVFWCVNRAKKPEFAKLVSALRSKTALAWLSTVEGKAILFSTGPSGKSRELAKNIAKIYNKGKRSDERKIII